MSNLQKKVDVRVGAVRFFKKSLKQMGMLKEREQLNDEHVQLFNQIRDVKEKEQSTWEYAINYVINNKGVQNPFCKAIDEVVKALQKLEQEWDKLDDETSDILFDCYPKKLGALDDLISNFEEFKHIVKITGV